MGRGKKWRREEDADLAAACAAVTSTGAREGPAFWDAVRARVQSARSVRALRNRCVLVSQDVKTFAQCLDRVEAAGASEEEAVERAMGTFRETKGRDFEFLSCWRLVRDCPAFRRGGEQTQQQEEEEEETVSTRVEVAAGGEVVVVSEVQTPAAAAVIGKETTELAQTAPGTGRAAGSTTTATVDLTFVQQQLMSEMRRKNDLQEDELAIKLFSEERESDESQRFFKLLKRKKLLQLEREVNELEQAQQRQRQRRG